MTLSEFAALKPGDKIELPMSGGQGTVNEVKKDGVMVTWGSSIISWHYSVASTAWMHWSKLDANV
jgi:preprotein translocase subunit YajC